jgi:hypothetical protein
MARAGTPSTSPRATTRRPGGRAGRARLAVASRAALRAVARSGCARSTGCHATLSVVGEQIRSTSVRSARHVPEPSGYTRLALKNECACALAEPAASLRWPELAPRRPPRGLPPAVPGAELGEPGWRWRRGLLSGPSRGRAALGRRDATRLLAWWASRSGAHQSARSARRVPEAVREATCELTKLCGRSSGTF